MAATLEAHAMKKFFVTMLLILPMVFLFAGSVRGDTGGMEGQGRYDVVAAPTTETQWDGIKYDRLTGETWMAIKGKWVVIEEKVTLPKSLYKIIIIPLRSDFEAVRLDTRSGKSWRLQGGNWQTMD
jgi:hypothetical protein